MAVKRFLPLAFKDNEISEQFNSLRSQTQIMFKENVESCILLGETRLKSSLLFQAALSFASEGDLVIFIRPNPFSVQPHQVFNMIIADSSILECIKMIYISNPSELLQYLCSFHTKECFPIAIIVDDILHYVSDYSEDERKEFALIKLFAILADTSGYVTCKKGEPCHYMVSLYKSLFPSHCFKRFFREIWFISRPDENSNEYFITDDSIPAFRLNIHVTEGNLITADALTRFQPVVEQCHPSDHLTTEIITGSVI